MRRSKASEKWRQPIRIEETQKGRDNKLKHDSTSLVQKQGRRGCDHSHSELMYSLMAAGRKDLL